MDTISNLSFVKLGLDEVYMYTGFTNKIKKVKCLSVHQYEKSRLLSIFIENIGFVSFDLKGTAEKCNDKFFISASILKQYLISEHTRKLNDIESSIIELYRRKNDLIVSYTDEIDIVEALIEKQKETLQIQSRKLHEKPSINPCNIAFKLTNSSRNNI